MFNGQSNTLITLMDLFFILGSYIILSLTFTLMNCCNEESDKDLKWIRLENFFKKFHVIKILYLLAAFLIVRTNVEIISRTLISNMQPIDVFGKINLLMVADVIAILIVWKTTLFQK